MINHFGKNPVSGGRPPIDNIMVNIIIVIRGMLFHMRAIEVVVVAELVISNMKVVVVIGM